MRWAEEYRQDAPMSQWGYNTNNPWQKENDDHTVCERPVSVMIDNFAPITCLLRGLFDYSADAEGLNIRPLLPDDVTDYVQNEPIYFGGCAVYLRFSRNGGPAAKDVRGTKLAANETGRFRIPAALMARGGKVCVSIRGGECVVASADRAPDGGRTVLAGDAADVPEDLAGICAECRKRLEEAHDPLLAAQLGEILSAAQTAALRRTLPFDRHEFRPMTKEKREAILNLYDRTVHELYDGLAFRRDARE
jgi:hypothetical protein